MAWPGLVYFSSIAITGVAAAALWLAQGRASAEPTGEVVSVSLSVFLSPATRGAGSDKPEYDTEYGKWEERSDTLTHSLGENRLRFGLIWIRLRHDSRRFS